MNNKIEKRVSCKEVDGIKYYFADFGSEKHNRTSFRLWVSSGLVQQIKDDEVERNVILFPMRARIHKTEKGSLVLKKGENYIYNVYVSCGFRGSAEIEVKTDIISSFEYFDFHSPLGNLGISKGLLIETSSEKLIYRWSKTGRLYGQSSRGVVIMYFNGKTEDITDIEVEELKEIND